MTTLRLSCIGLAFCALPASLPAQEAEAPLSAIEWLDQVLAAPLPEPEPAPSEAPVILAPDSGQAQSGQIAATPLDSVEIDSTGLFRAERIGLPRDVWGPTPLPDILDALENLPQDTLPRAQQLALRVLTAEFAPPWSLAPEDRGLLLAARVEQLIARGALEQAGQLIDAAPERTAGLNARAFDIALLLGEEDAACARMSGQIAQDHGQAAQIFCTARRGDWPAAYASLQAAKTLGLLSGSEDAILTRFLEEEEAESLLPPPQDMTPLLWRMMEALGDSVTTANLPLAYAHADLRGTSGWRAQLDAAERLTRAGAMQPNRLLGLYTQRRAAASGGLWERVAAVQALEQARMARDAEAVGGALLRAWPLFAAVELEHALAEMMAADLAHMALTGQAAERLWHILLLTEEAPERAASLAPEDEFGQFMTALAQGSAPPDIAASGMAGAIALGFADEMLSDEVRQQIDNGALAMVLFDALGFIADAVAGDQQAATRGLQRLRALGLDDDARQIAIELLLLERRG